jgi:hypothetical protein
MMSAMTPEGKIKKKLVEMLKNEKVWYFFPAANGMGKAGIPDVICIVEGQFVGIECKADETKKPTTLQLMCAKDIRAAGGYWFLVFDDYSIADVEKWIQTWKNR